MESKPARQKANTLRRRTDLLRGNKSGKKITDVFWEKHKKKWEGFDHNVSGYDGISYYDVSTKLRGEMANANRI